MREKCARAEEDARGQGEYFSSLLEETEFDHDAKSGQIGDLRALSDSPARSPNARDESFFTIARAPFYRSMIAGVASENLK